MNSILIGCLLIILSGCSDRGKTIYIVNDQKYSGVITISECTNRPNHGNQIFIDSKGNGCVSDFDIFEGWHGLVLLDNDDLDSGSNTFRFEAGFVKLSWADKTYKLKILRVDNLKP